MFRILLAGILGLAVAGCHHEGSVRIESEWHHHDHNCGHYWDGHGWLFVSGHVHHEGCGHHYHHSQWHVYPESHVYVDTSYRHFGVTVERSHVEESSPTHPREGHEAKPQPPHPGTPEKPDKPKKPK